MTRRRKENVGDRVGKPPKKDASPETGTPSENLKPVERYQKQTGEKEKLYFISVKDVSEGTEKREKLFC